MSSKRLKRPCKGCPFSRKTEPGALGGSPVAVYIGQAALNFWLPCHSNQDYTTDQGRRDLSTQQCAGAASFRSVCQRFATLPEVLHSLPYQPEVFASHEEMVRHHLQIPDDEPLELDVLRLAEAALRAAGTQVIDGEKLK